MMGTMSMYYVTNPDGVVASVQRLVDETKYTPAVLIPPTPVTQPPVAEPRPETTEKPIISGRHSLDTREKIRDVLR